MTQQSTGIQQLLVAEKRASEKVSDARKRKTKKLKQAKDEAQQEIEQYKAERERQYKEYETKHMGSKDDLVKKVDGDTQLKKIGIDRMVNTNKEDVITLLLDLVYDIKPEVHENFKSGIKQEE